LDPFSDKSTRTLGPDPKITWVALCYLLTTSIGLLFVGRVTDIFGRRYWFIGGSAIGTIGSIVCSRSTSVEMLIGGQTLIGIGASVQLSYACELIELLLWLIADNFVDAVGEIVPITYRFVATAFV
jgi:MFS family permease